MDSLQFNRVEKELIEPKESKVSMCTGCGNHEAKHENDYGDHLCDDCESDLDGVA